MSRALRVLGTIRRDEGLEELQEAVAVIEDSPARLERAKALAALGTALRLARRPTDAREPLRQALELASVCGAAPLAEHVRTELHAAGVRPRRDALSGVESLTPSERRVADLAAAGRHQPRRGPGALRDAQDRRGPPEQRVPQARDPFAPRAAGGAGGLGQPAGTRRVCAAIAP